MYEYKMESVSMTEGPSPEHKANTMAKQGWRLVSTVAHHYKLQGPLTFGQAMTTERRILAQTLCLWFEREVQS